MVRRIQFWSVRKTDEAIYWTHFRVGLFGVFASTNLYNLTPSASAILRIVSSFILKFFDNKNWKDSGWKKFSAWNIIYLTREPKAGWSPAAGESNLLRVVPYLTRTGALLFAFIKSNNKSFLPNIWYVQQDSRKVGVSYPSRWTIKQNNRSILYQGAGGYFYVFDI